jgi:hypothetical protein
MSDDGTLKNLLLEWSNNNEEILLGWSNELMHNDIDYMQDLVLRAMYKETWQKLLNNTSEGLEAKLRLWYDKLEKNKKRKADFSI